MAVAVGLASAAWAQTSQPAVNPDEPVLQPLLPQEDWSVGRPGLLTEDANSAIWPAGQAPADANARPHDAPRGIVTVVTRIPEPTTVLLILGGLLVLRTRH